jgi:hypothetical protein
MTSALRTAHATAGKRLVKKSGSGIFLRSRCEDCTKIIVARVEASVFRAFYFHAEVDWGCARLRQALQLSPGRRVD